MVAMVGGAGWGRTFLREPESPMTRHWRLPTSPKEAAGLARSPVPAFLLPRGPSRLRCPRGVRGPSREGSAPGRFRRNQPAKPRRQAPGSEGLRTASTPLSLLQAPDLPELRRRPPRGRCGPESGRPHPMPSRCGLSLFSASGDPGPSRPPRWSGGGRRGGGARHPGLGGALASGSPRAPGRCPGTRFRSAGPPAPCPPASYSCEVRAQNVRGIARHFFELGFQCVNGVKSLSGP